MPGLSNELAAAQNSIVRIMFANPLVHLWANAAQYRVRGLLDPERTALAGRPWGDCQ